MSELDHKKGWALKNWLFWNVVLEKILESPLSCKEIKPVNPKGNQSWIFIGRTDVETEAPILWSLDAKSHLIRKTPDAGKNWRQEEKGTTEDEMVPPSQWTPVWVSFGSWWRTRTPGMLQSMGSQSWTWLGDWTTANYIQNMPSTLNSEIHWNLCFLKVGICRRHHPYGRKWRTKEPLDEIESGEWRSWLKAQHSEN